MATQNIQTTKQSVRIDGESIALDLQQQIAAFELLSQKLTRQKDQVYFSKNSEILRLNQLLKSHINTQKNLRFEKITALTQTFKNQINLGCTSKHCLFCYIEQPNRFGRRGFEWVYSFCHLQCRTHQPTHLQNKSKRKNTQY